MTNDRLLRQEEVKELLGVSDSFLEQGRLKGEGPRFVKIGRAVRYRYSDVQAYIAKLPCFNNTTEVSQQVVA